MFYSWVGKLSILLFFNNVEIRPLSLVISNNLCSIINEPLFRSMIKKYYRNGTFLNLTDLTYLTDLTGLPNLTDLIDLTDQCRVASNSLVVWLLLLLESRCLITIIIRVSLFDYEPIFPCSSKVNRLQKQHLASQKTSFSQLRSWSLLTLSGFVRSNCCFCEPINQFLVKQDLFFETAWKLLNSRTVVEEKLKMNRKNWKIGFEIWEKSGKSLKPIKNWKIDTRSKNFVHVFQ